VLNTLKPFPLLLLSGFLIMLGNGLSNILLPVRMQHDGVDIGNIGIVLSMYSVGFLLGAIYCRRLLQRVGHIQTFAICGSMTAVAILLSGLYSDPLVLGAMRIITGFCIACTNATLDSWLGHSATEKNRGRILAVNQIIIMSALFSGQFLLNLAPVESTTLFILAGILFSFSITPIVIGRHKGPFIEDSQGMSFFTIVKLSPLGVVSCFFCGVLYSGLLNMLPIFASNNGIEGFDLSVFMGAAIAGAIILQFPIAYLSDHFDRRKVMFGMVATFIVFSILIPFLIYFEWFKLTLIALAITTGLAACLYPMSISEAFDKVIKEQILAAMGSLLAIYALGSILGPYSAAIAMESLGNNALFGFTVVAAFLLLIFISIRMKKSEALAVDDQESFVMQTPSGAVSVLDPRTVYTQSELSTNAGVQIAVNLAYENPAIALNMVKALARRDIKNASRLVAGLSQIKEVNIGKLYSAIVRIAPYRSIRTAQILIDAAPERAEQLVDWIIMQDDDDMCKIIVAIAAMMPDNGINILQYAAQKMVGKYPLAILAMTEEYINILSSSLDEMRPVDRVATDPQQTATELYNRMQDVSPEQSADIAITISEALPDASFDVAEAYLHNLLLSEEHPFKNRESIQKIQDAISLYMKEVAKSLPEHAVKVANTFIEIVPDVASSVVEIIQDAEQYSDSYLTQTITDKPVESQINEALQKAVELQNVDDT
jgi:MFS family permease